MSRVALSTLILASACAAVACGTSDDTKSEPVQREHVTPEKGGGVNVAVEFPDDGARGVTSTVHIWVLSPTEGNTANCADLVGGELDPYSPTLTRKGDLVVKDGLEGPTSLKDTGTGKVFVYVEAVDYSGHVDWAGCQEITVSGGAASSQIQLGKARIYDCGDPAAEDGAPCDDGKLCTVGETCQGGSCSNGKARACEIEGDLCNAGTCDEAKGCVVTPVNGRACSDGDPCTTDDKCLAGQCTGTPRDCAAEAGPCQTSQGCDQTYGDCVFIDAPYGTACDDGLFCTENDYCDYYGTCTGSYRDCTGTGGDYYCGGSGTCDETLDTCTNSYAPAGSYCYSGLYCQTNESCDGLGHCVGTPRSCAGYGECYSPVCSETYGGCGQPQPSTTLCSAYTTTDCYNYWGITGMLPHCDGYGSCSLSNCY